MMMEPEAVLQAQGRAGGFCCCATTTRSRDSKWVAHGPPGIRLLNVDADPKAQIDV